jgi:Histidine kinase-, DNA gyrase B-, and HSP90-like ATPase
MFTGLAHVPNSWAKASKGGHGIAFEVVMTQTEWRLRLARWLAPPAEVAVEDSADQAPSEAWVKEAWVRVCEQFALRMLVLAEQLRPALDRLEKDEDDPDRLQWLYHVDHGVSRIRRAARDLRVLAGRESEEIIDHSSSLLEVIRAATSAIEHFDRISVGPVVELGMMAYAADDFASLLAALADNATQYSPSEVRISAHLLGDGAVMVRVEDSGIGIEPERLALVNIAMAGPVPEVDVYTGAHTGFSVIHRLARKHGLEVRFACRPTGRHAIGATTGTIAMVTIPASLICEIPESVSGAPPVIRDVVPPARGASNSTVLGAPWPATPPPSSPVRPEVNDRTGQPFTRNGLPRREPGTARNAILAEMARPDRGDPQDPAMAGHSFAADVTAFMSADPRPQGLSPTSGFDAQRREPEGQTL